MTEKWKKSTCSHEQATMVIKVGKARIWGGAQVELLERPGWALVISAIGFSAFSAAPLTANKSAQALLPKALLAWEPPPCVGIDWPDCGIPTLSTAWWNELATAVKGISGDIGLCCAGGHGRTGVMLAVLAAKLGKVKKGDCPVAWVRKRYCEKAVESSSQLDYIERITGYTVSSEASNGTDTAGWPTSYSYPGAIGSGNPAGSAPAASTTNPAAFTPSQAKRAAATPTPPSLEPPAIKSGPATGTLAAGMSDDELLEAWFEVDTDGIKVMGDNGEPEYLRPVWDDEGSLAGWKPCEPEPGA